MHEEITVREIPAFLIEFITLNFCLVISLGYSNVFSLFFKIKPAKQAEKITLKYKTNPIKLLSYSAAPIPDITNAADGLLDIMQMS